MPDYIPRGDEQFLTWAGNLLTYAAAHATAMKVDPATIPPVQAKLTAYQTAFNTAANPNRGKVDVLNKNETRDALKSAIRVFVKAYVAYNPDVTDADKESMGLPLHDKTRTPVPPPTSVPEAEIDSSVLRQITIHFRASGSSSKAKPAGVHGVEIVSEIAETQPPTMAGFNNSAFDTNSPYTFNYDESQRGKKVWYCLRWENFKGDKGPWSEIYSAIIP